MCLHNSRPTLSFAKRSLKPTLSFAKRSLKPTPLLREALPKVNLNEAKDNQGLLRPTSPFAKHSRRHKEAIKIKSDELCCSLCSGLRCDSIDGGGVVAWNRAT